MTAVLPSQVYPRIDRHGQDIDDEIRSDDSDSEHKRDELHDKVVAREDRRHHELAEAGNGKDLLDDDRPADQPREIDAEQRDGGYQRIGKYVSEEDAVLRHA